MPQEGAIASARNPNLNAGREKKKPTGQQRRSREQIGAKVQTILRGRGGSQLESDRERTTVRSEGSEKKKDTDERQRRGHVGRSERGKVNARVDKKGGTDGRREGGGKRGKRGGGGGRTAWTKDAAGGGGGGGGRWGRRKRGGEGGEGGGGRGGGGEGGGQEGWGGGGGRGKEGGGGGGGRGRRRLAGAL